MPDLTIDRRLDGSDGSTKLRLLTGDGHAVEAVLMQFERGGGGVAARAELPPRFTACLSSQSGCALSCTFCATGRMRLGRSLTRDEIVEQFDQLTELLRERSGMADARIDNVVMMGMGEPFHNYDEVLPALEVLATHKGGGRSVAPRRITISTVGWVPGIERLAREPLPVKLALSLHAPDDVTRGRLMPVNKRFPIARLMQACGDYTTATGRGVFVEYLLLDGINDADHQAEQLADLLIEHRVSETAFHVNLIAYNPAGTEYLGSSPEVVHRFRSTLRGRGIETSYRVSRGRDIAGACGQLAAPR